MFQKSADTSKSTIFKSKLGQKIVQNWFEISKKLAKNMNSKRSKVDLK